MMGPVAERGQDNTQDDGSEQGGANLPAPRPDSSPAEAHQEPQPEPGSELASRSPSELLSEEELRQFREFQEFQRFREYQAEKGGELPPAESREVEPTRWRDRTPAWLTALGGKLLTAALVLLAVAAGGAWAINHYLGGSDGPSSAELAEQGGKKAEATKLYASDPYEAVRRVYDHIAQTDPDTGKPEVEKVCLRFDEVARVRFASDLGYASCEQAVLGINAEITHVNDYAESMPSWVSDPVTTDSVRISSCADSLGGTIIGGPALGTFIVTKIPDAKGEQWLITGHEPGPRSCPAPKRTGSSQTGPN
ncbi:hypothetical protein AmyhaDRAFT_0200 [Haloechinothrix halophila YIM 93223]|uniref:Uncharacterized protein n=1 Tax=Haloechinothrix halophila YIM 93223 TaxID=592678 RepID=W9DNF0_9PSEU|nr:hypothetical protein AmyhaDRAFT_0200 [Haloechinothrix halophila YIM 93223]